MTTVGVCSLMPTETGPGRCDWCDGSLPKGRRRWCSTECLRDYEANHDWNSARIRRIATDDGVCQQCGVKCRTEWWSGWREHPEYPADVGSYQELAQAHRKFVKRVCLPLTPEVNHKDPRVGQGYGWGCWNHQDNLETLCHRCHVKVTTAQRRSRQAAAAQRVFRGG